MNNEWHLYSVKAAFEGELTLCSAKRNLKIVSQVLNKEESGIQALHVTSAIDADGTPLHVSPREIIYFHPGRLLASFDKGKLQTAVSG